MSFSRSPAIITLKIGFIDGLWLKKKKKKENSFTFLNLLVVLSLRNQ